MFFFLLDFSPAEFFLPYRMLTSKHCTLQTLHAALVEKGSDLLV